MLFLARWARRLSWKETAEAFRTSWDKVFDAVEHVVNWGLEHRMLGQIDAIGVDEIQYAKGHKYLTLVYQIDLGITRLLWVGKERTIESFEGFFTAMGKGRYFQNRIRLLRPVGTLPEAHPQTLLRGAAYPRPLPHRRQYEQSTGSRPCRGNQPYET